MTQRPRLIRNFFIGDPQADRIVPGSGFTARLTFMAAVVMGFLACFALAFATSAGRLADRWSTDLARSSTLRISAPDTQVDAQLQVALEVLQTTPGVASARIVTREEQQQLLAPWFGDDLPLDNLPIPQMIELVEDDSGIDAEALQFRLAGEVPGASLDDHQAWRAPLVRASNGLRNLGLLAVLLIGIAMIAMVTLAAQSALAANQRVIETLRLIGARDDYIAMAFIRRFSWRSLSGAAIGALLALLLIYFLPAQDGMGDIISGIGFALGDWPKLIIIPVFAGVVGFVATRFAAYRALKGMS